MTTRKAARSLQRVGRRVSKRLCTVKLTIR